MSTAQKNNVGNVRKEVKVNGAACDSRSAPSRWGARLATAAALLKLAGCAREDLVFNDAGSKDAGSDRGKGVDSGVDSGVNCTRVSQEIHEVVFLKAAGGCTQASCQGYVGDGDTVDMNDTTLTVKGVDSQMNALTLTDPSGKKVTVTAGVGTAGSCMRADSKSCIEVYGTSLEYTGRTGTQNKTTTGTVYVEVTYDNGSAPAGTLSAVLNEGQSETMDFGYSLTATVTQRMVLEANGGSGKAYVDITLTDGKSVLYRTLSLTEGTDKTFGNFTVRLVSADDRQKTGCTDAKVMLVVNDKLGAKPITAEVDNTIVIGGTTYVVQLQYTTRKDQSTGETVIDTKKTAVSLVEQGATKNAQNVAVFGDKNETKLRDGSTYRLVKVSTKDTSPSVEAGTKDPYSDSGVTTSPDGGA